MKCKDCQSFQEIANTAECGKGICTFPCSYFMVDMNDDCHFMPSSEVRCGDCHRLLIDTACLTCMPEDSAYHNGHLCGGFIDAQEIALAKSISIWKARGWDYHEIIQKVIQEVESAPQPGVPKSPPQA